MAMRGRMLLIGGCAAVAVAVVFVLDWLGFPVPFVVAWMLVLLTIGIIGRQAFVDEGAEWPPQKPSRTTRGSEVSRMAWAINTRTGVAGHLVVRRVQSVLRRRLAHRGLDLDDPEQHDRIDAMLGEGVREALHRREVRRTDIELVLDAIDRIPTDLEENR